VAALCVQQPSSDAAQQSKRQQQQNQQQQFELLSSSDCTDGEADRGSCSSTTSNNSGDGEKAGLRDSNSTSTTSSMGLESLRDQAGGAAVVALAASEGWLISTSSTDGSIDSSNGRSSLLRVRMMDSNALISRYLQ
jgi:hypothetical protein